MWLTDGELRIYDGADYVTATPALFARYLAATGGYFTGAFGVPDRIRDVLVEETDLNTITDSGWYKTSADAVNSPIAGVHSVETRIMSGTRGFQVLWVTNGKGSYYTRLKDGPAWDTTWDLTTPFVLPARLAGEQAPADDANLMVESGFYGVDDSTANRPFDHGSITVVQFEEDRITQQGIDSTGRILMTRSSLDGGDTWSDWAGAGGSPGEVTWHAASTVPFGKLKANGALVSRVTYAALFAVIGTTFGAGDGATTFRLPDLRGEFVRGWDDGRGIDIGRTFGSWQDSENKSHTHVANADSGGAHTHSGTTDSNTHNHAIETMLYTNGGAYSGPIVLRRQSASVNYEVQYIGNSTHSHTVTIPASGAHTHTVTVNSSGGVESRPRNVALLACIKY